MPKWNLLVVSSLLVAVAGVTWGFAQQRNAADASAFTADDYIEIQQLYARYAHTVDLDPDGEAWADTFTPDGAHGDHIVGHEALAEYARMRRTRGLLDGPNMRHWNSQLVITPTPEGADGSCFLLLVSVGNREDPPKLLATMTYHDKLVKTKDGWRFKKRTFTPEKVEPVAVSLDTAPVPTGETVQENRATSGSPAVQRVDSFTPLTAPRIPPLDPSSLTAAHQEVTGPQGGSTQLRICLHNLEMCRQYWAFTRHLGFHYTLPLRDKELLILRTAWLSRGDFIWGVHSTGGGQRAGITGEELRRIPRGPAASGWSDFDAALLRAADELHATRFITDATWASLAERYDEGQLLEVLFVVGNYTLLAMFHNSVGVPLEPGVPGLPQ